MLYWLQSLVDEEVTTALDATKACRHCVSVDRRRRTSSLSSSLSLMRCLAILVAIGMISYSVTGRRHTFSLRLVHELSPTFWCAMTLPMTNSPTCYLRAIGRVIAFDHADQPPDLWMFPTTLSSPAAAIRLLILWRKRRSANFGLTVVVRSLKSESRHYNIGEII